MPLRTILSPIAVAAILSAGCLDVPDDDAPAAVVTKAAPTTPHWKFSDAHTAFLEGYGFQGLARGVGHQRYSSGAPQPKEVPLQIVFVTSRSSGSNVLCRQNFTLSRQQHYDRVFTSSDSIAAYVSAQSAGRYQYKPLPPILSCDLPAELNMDTARDVAFRAVDARYDFASFDRAGGVADGVVTSEELTILVIAAGTGHAQARWVDPSGYRNVDGVRYHGLLSAVTGNQQMDTVAHELMHTLGAQDLYGGWPHGAFHADTTIMGGTDRPRWTMLDAWHRLQFGWLRPDVIQSDAPRSGEKVLYCADDARAELDGSLLFADERARGRGEFALVEARCRQSRFDAEGPARGVAIWSVESTEGRSGVYAGPLNCTLQGDGTWSCGCTPSADGSWTCPRERVCLTDPTSSPSEPCRVRRFVQPGDGWVPAQFADGTAVAWIKVSEEWQQATPESRFALVGYRVTWSTRIAGTW